MNKGSISLNKLDFALKGSNSGRKRATEIAETKQKDIVNNSINKVYKK